MSFIKNFFYLVVFVFFINLQALSWETSKCSNFIASFILAKNGDHNQIRYLQKSLSKNKDLILRIDAQRLINPIDWDKAKKKFPNNPWLYYGEKTINDWQVAAKFVKDNASNFDISIETLKKIHRIAAQNLYFRGYQFRRILEAHKKGKISTEQKDEMLKKIKNGEKVYLIGTKNDEQLLGVFRHKSLDNFIHTGEQFLAQDDIDKIQEYYKGDRWKQARKDFGIDTLTTNTRYMTLKEYQDFKANPWMEFANPPGLLEAPPNSGKYLGRFNYVKAKDVQQKIKKIISKGKKAIENSKSPKKIIKAVVEMQRDLMSVHPFLDGNGRTVRLFSDSILQKFGLPPQFYPNESDLQMPLDKQYIFVTEGMLDYLEKRFYFQTR